MRREHEQISYLELATLPSAPFWARCQTRASLKAWQLQPETIETAELLVSELVTNAIKMSGPTPGALGQSGVDGLERIFLMLRLMPGRLVIEVFDHDQNPPILTDADTDAEGGRGLMLVQALSKEWGHFLPPTGGKTVYCVLGLPPLITPT
jgi:anti-sigma regulatory factor (Ser/Thr protein kinase)